MSKHHPSENSERTKDRIIDAAEALIAEFGINGVTFREIGLAAGHNNKSGVQYHFGDKVTLVNAILRKRFEKLEQRRIDLFNELQSAGRLETVRSCVELLHRPVAELTDKNGMHTYAKFYLQYIATMRYDKRIIHPGWIIEPTMTSQKVYELLQKLLWYIPEPVLRTRVFQVDGILLVALLDYDNAVMHNEPHDSWSDFIDAVFNVMTTAVNAPLAAP